MRAARPLLALALDTALAAPAQAQATTVDFAAIAERVGAGSARASSSAPTAAC